MALPSEPSFDQIASARELAHGHDAYQIYQDWLAWGPRQTAPVKDAKAAFRGFVRRWMDGRPTATFRPVQLTGDIDGTHRQLGGGPRPVLHAVSGRADWRWIASA